VTLRNKLAWMLATLAFCLAPCQALQGTADSEDELKSATVWLFVQYSQLAPGADGSITVGVLGRPSFVKVLRRNLDGKSTGGHAVKVVEAKADLRCCQIVYLATDKNEEIRRVMQNAQPVRALTLGESDRFLEQGGAVNLFIADGHIGFEASLEALDRCGVSVSSNLLKFGQIRNRGKGSGAK
jgi:hypothetical protein